jgi:hypothetical protein
MDVEASAHWQDTRFHLHRKRLQCAAGSSGREILQYLQGQKDEQKDVLDQSIICSIKTKHVLIEQR